MSSKKDLSTEEELSIVDVMGNSPPKKHKKHKHRKHKRRKDALKYDDGDLDLLNIDVADLKPALKLKFKIGGKSLGEKSVAIIQGSAVDEENELIEVVEDVPTIPTPASDISDEDAWLEALESGKLDEYDEMKRMKDPALMTARQRALFRSKSHRDTSLEEYLMLPTGYKEKEMTEEMLQKREIRAKKRRQQAQEKREKDKIETIDRLLKKQDPRPKGAKSKASKKMDVPKFRYIINSDMRSISVPVGFDFPFAKKQISEKQEQRPLTCGIVGCYNPKKYSCSRTGIPLCSLECYKINLGLLS